jgi:hypothetical protein
MSRGKEITTSTLERLFLGLEQGLRNGCSRLNRWVEEHYDLIETEAVTLNGPPDGWTYPKSVRPSFHT